MNDAKLFITTTLVVIGCLTLSACETMEEFYDEVIVASVNETIVDPVKNTELSYCAGCDWIVQEFHGEWSTHNSKPYDTKSECDAARRKQQNRDPDVPFRCIHESQLP
jgi:hypothetical protein